MNYVVCITFESLFSKNVDRPTDKQTDRQTDIQTYIVIHSEVTPPKTVQRQLATRRPFLKSNGS